jgi:hypothetical protein
MHSFYQRNTSIQGEIDETNFFLELEFDGRNFIGGDLSESRGMHPSNRDQLE